MDQKGLKMYEKRQKIEFMDRKNLFFSRILLSGIGGYPPRPLTENHPAQKPLAEKIRKVVFDSLPNQVHKKLIFQAFSECSGQRCV